MNNHADISQLILDKALELAGYKSWETLRLYEIAEALEISLDDIRQYYPQKDDLVDAWFDRADQAMLLFASSGQLQQYPIRERIKQVYMAWLSSLAPYRKVTGDMLLYKLEPAHIHLQVLGLLRISRTVQWMREAIMSNTTHFCRISEEVGLTSLYVATFIYWLGDDSFESKRTQVFLERQLLRAESLINRLKWFTPKEHPPTPELSKSVG